MILLMNVTLGMICTHCKLMLPLLWEGDKLFGTAIKRRYQMQNMGSTWYKFWATSETFCVSKTLYIALSVARIMCMLHFSFVVHQYLVHHASHSNHLIYLWYCLAFGFCINHTFCHFFTACKGKFSNPFSWLPCW